MPRQHWEEMHRNSLLERDFFWGAAAKDIDWVKPPSKILDESSKPFFKWFPGGELNVCYNAVDRHLPTRRDQAAIIYDSPVTGTVRSISYGELHDEVSRTAGLLESLGVQSGDRVVIYMPVIPEAVFAMLACARLGAVHSVVFAGFGAKELSVRIDDSQPKVVLTASCGIEPSRVVECMPLLNSAIELCSAKPQHVVVKQREQCRAQLTSGRDLDWDEAVAKAHSAACRVVDANHPLYILYTSGTTGTPKGILHDGGPHAVALKWSMSNFMRTEPGETYWAASDVGWVVGHSYIVYAPLLQGCTTVLFEGKPVLPDAGVYWRVIEQHKVRALFTAPTALRAIRKEDPKLELMKGYDLSSLRTLFVAGERCDPTTANVYQGALGIPVVDHWWQTETGWPICGFRDEAVGTRPGSAGLPFPGYDVKVLGTDSGEELGAGEMGSLAVWLPLPPSCFPTLWRREEDYVKFYMTEFPGYYSTGDTGIIDKDGYVTVLERNDDVINVAAHRLSTGTIEAVIKATPGVSDAAVVGVDDEVKGTVPLACIVLASDGAHRGEEICEEIRHGVRKEIGAIAGLAAVVPVAQLPKTRSGKVLRKNIRGLANGKPFPVPGTIDNPEAMSIVVEALKNVGYAQGL